MNTGPILPVAGSPGEIPCCENSIASATKIDDYPAGYPRFSALISKHHSFFIFRRFLAVRARILLSKQDEISRLESTLEKIDLDEPRLLFHGSLRRDTNQERKTVLKELEKAVTGYDNLLQNIHRALSFTSPRDRNVSNLKNWLGGLGCLSREESAYLSKEDLLSIGPSDSEDIFESIEGPVEDAIIWLSSVFGKDLRLRVTSDANLHIFSQRLISNVSRILVAFVPSAVLLIPMIVSSSLESSTWRLIVVLSFTVVFAMILSLLARVKLGDLLAAGAAYAAVLVVYISGSNN